MNNVGIKSEKLYHICSLYGTPHELSLISREYKFGYCIYILKVIITFYKKGVKFKKVYKRVFRSRDNALRALRHSIYDITIDNINNQLSLPF